MTSQEELFKENSKAILQRYIMKEGYIVFRLFTLRHRRPYFFFWNDYSWQSSITHFLLLTPVQAQRKRQREFLDEHSIKTRTFKFLETFPRAYVFHSNDFLEVAVSTNNRFRNMFTWCFYIGI